MPPTRRADLLADMLDFRLPYQRAIGEQTGPELWCGMGPDHGCHPGIVIGIRMQLHARRRAPVDFGDVIPGQTQFSHRTLAGWVAAGSQIISAHIDLETCNHPFENPRDIADREDDRF